MSGFPCNWPSPFPSWNTPLLQSQRIDWRERTFVTRPLYAQDRAQALGVSRADVAATLALDALDLPPGYRLEWGGEYESSRDAQQSLGRQMPLAFGIMLLITVLLFGKLRQTAVIWTVVPMAVTGAAVGLLVTGLPFSFTALLGLLSLSGMLIKNAIVLVEEIDAYKVENGLWQSEAIVQASITRVRPVMLAAGTTILGMAPLVFDPFFASMAVTIMAGLGFASILTLVGVPVLYHTYLRAERRAEESGPRSNVRRGGGPSASWAPAVFMLASAAVEERRILGTALDRAREAERVAEALLAEGVVTPAAVSQARADRAELEGGIQEARSREDAARWALQQVTGRPLDAAVPELGERLRFPVGSGTAEVSWATFDPESATHRREELARLDAQLRAAEAALGGARAGRLPTLALVADPGFQGPRVRLDGDSRTASVSLVGSWTVFGGGRIRAGVAEAEARRTQLLQARSLAAEGLELEARVAHRALVAAEAALPAAEARLVAAGEAYALTLERFREGVASPFELTDARAGLSAAELGQALALHRRLLAWIDFEHAAGLRPMGPLAGP
ncbi:MAG: hypothetical protein EA422_16310 [Gemmatimonadales bacterium]|nr:MAG: hypothetical protein EA422_16310 [Gemmatimonadales bacterium]